MPERPTGPGSRATPRPLRRRVEAALDRFVREHRVTVSVVVPVVGAVLLVGASRGVVPEALAFHPWLLLGAVLAMRLPLVAALLPAVGRRAAAGVLAVVGLAYVVEFVGLTTGVPYGEFAYGRPLGPMVGGVPAGLPLFFVPLVLDVVVLVDRLLGARADRWAVRAGAALAALLAVDLVLDPGAVALGFWSYADGGAYYDVPASNYLGWTLTGGLAVLLATWALPRAATTAALDRAPYALDDLVSFVVLWGVVNLAWGQWVPLAVAVVLGVLLARAVGLPGAARLRALGPARRWLGG